MDSVDLNGNILLRKMSSTGRSGAVGPLGLCEGFGRSSGFGQGQGQYFEVGSELTPMKNSETPCLPNLRWHISIPKTKA